MVELVAAIVVVAILATGFLSAFSVVLKTSASPLQLNVMESLAASEMDRLLSGTFQSAVQVPVSQTFNVDGTDYFVFYSVQNSVVSSVPVTSGVHVGVTVNTANCVSCVSLYGDTFNVQ